MEWPTLIFVAFVVVSWIASNIKQMQKAAAAAAPPPLPPGEPGQDAPPRQVDQVQEFLKQIRKRMGEPEAQPEKPVEPMRAVLVEESRRQEAAKREQRKRLEAPPPKPKKKKEADAAPNLSRRRAEVTTLAAESIPLTAALASDPAPMISQTRRPTSTAARDALKLLKSPTGLATTFLLREILEPPLSKRRRSRQ